MAEVYERCDRCGSQLQEDGGIRNCPVCGIVLDDTLVATKPVSMEKIVDRAMKLYKEVEKPAYEREDLGPCGIGLCVGRIRKFGGVRRCDTCDAEVLNL